MLQFTWGLAAAESNGQAWIQQADSLREVGLDAAALDFLQSAEQQFRKAGEPCWVARFAERKARIHLDWRNPRHASECLAAALLAADACPELADAVRGWRFALAQARLDEGARSEARWILQELTAEGPWEGQRLEFRLLAAEARGRLAHMSLEEGDLTAAAEDFHLWADDLAALGRAVEELEALGWGAVSATLAGSAEDGLWERIRRHPAWVGLTIQDRATRCIDWSHMLLAAGATESFDALATWPWAARLEQAPGSVDPLLEARWALLRARRNRKEHVAQALAASHQAALAARNIADRDRRDATLSEALRLRAGILASTGAHGPAYVALREADSLSTAHTRQERARAGLFESEPWLSAIGDARTQLETERMLWWRRATGVCAVLCVIAFLLFWRTSVVRTRLRTRLRHLQQHWLPGRQHQVRELARSGAMLATSAHTHALPAELKRDLAEFGRLAALCADEVRHEPVDLKALCMTLAAERQAGGRLDWSLHEEVPFRGDAVQLKDFLSILLSGLGHGGCRMAMHSTASGLEVAFDDFAERGWWRQAMTLFAGDGEERHWSMIRLRCDRLGGALKLDCNAAGANRLRVDLPVYSA